jgi:hypothetical protein
VVAGSSPVRLVSQATAWQGLVVFAERPGVAEDHNDVHVAGVLVRVVTSVDLRDRHDGEPERHPECRRSAEPGLLVNPRSVLLPDRDHLARQILDRDWPGEGRSNEGPRMGDLRGLHGREYLPRHLGLPDVLALLMVHPR